MKNILYILFSICLLTACSGDDENSTDGQKEKEQQQIKSLTHYSLGTPKNDIDFDIELSPDTLIRLYARSVMVSNEPINPQTVFCLKNGILKTILVEYHSRITYDLQFLSDVSCFDPSLKLDLQTTENNDLRLIVDSVKGKYNNAPILIRNGFMHSLPKQRAIIIEYAKVQ